MFNYIWNWDFEGRNTKKSTKSAKKYQNPVFSRVDILLMISRVDILLMVAQNSIIHKHFRKELNKIFQMNLTIFPKLWRILGCNQQKIQKMSHFWHFNDHNSGSKHDNQINDPIFVIYSPRSVHWNISFLHFKILCNLFWPAKYTFTYQRWHFQAC